MTCTEIVAKTWLNMSNAAIFHDVLFAIESFEPTPRKNSWTLGRDRFEVWLEDVEEMRYTVVIMRRHRSSRGIISYNRIAAIRPLDSSELVRDELHNITFYLGLSSYSLNEYLCFLA